MSAEQLTRIITQMYDIPSPDGTPQSLFAEQQVLGSLMLDNRLVDRIQGQLTPEHFFEPLHGRIFQTILASVARDRLASPVTLTATFAADPALQELGGWAYLARMAGAAIASTLLVKMAAFIVEMSERRRLLELTSQSAERLRTGTDAAAVVETLEAELLTGQGATAAPRSMSLLKAATKTIEEMNDRYQYGSTGVPSGLTALDALTGGFHRAEFTIIGGATSMGKTALGTWIAHAAARRGYGVGFATLEMGETQLYHRINAIDSRVPYQDQRRDLTEARFRQIVATTEDQHTLPMEFFNSQIRTVHGLFAEARKLQRRWQDPTPPFRGLGLVVVDYIQLLRGPGTPLEVLAEAAIECKNMAKRLDIPVLGLAQVNRSIAQRDNKVPGLADLRGSGDLEFAADNVVFCHRPDYYLERELQSSTLSAGARADAEVALARCRNTMDLFVAKQRMGAIGRCRLGCDMATNRFWDLEPDHQNELAV